MQYTSHWAALYFVALMTFGNYVLFNLLVAILVEGFSNQVSVFSARPRARTIRFNNVAAKATAILAFRSTSFQHEACASQLTYDIQGSARMPFPGCEKVAGKFRQHWYAMAGIKLTMNGNLAEPCM